MPRLLERDERTGERVMFPARVWGHESGDVRTARKGVDSRSGEPPTPLAPKRRRLATRQLIRPNGPPEQAGRVIRFGHECLPTTLTLLAARVRCTDGFGGAAVLTAPTPGRHQERGV